MDARRNMRLELLVGIYSKIGTAERIDDGELIARAEYHHEDEKQYGIQSMNLWGLQDHEITFIYSGGRLDPETYEYNMRRSLEEAGDFAKPSKKLRSATVTSIMVYDSADDDVVAAVEAHNDKTTHKMSLNGWTINRVALVLTDDRKVVVDKRGSSLLRRLTRIAEI